MHSWVKLRQCNSGAQLAIHQKTVEFTGTVDNCACSGKYWPQQAIMTPSGWRRRFIQPSTERATSNELPPAQHIASPSYRQPIPVPSSYQLRAHSSVVPPRVAEHARIASSTAKWPQEACAHARLLGWTSWP